MHPALDIAEIRQSVSGFCDDPSLSALSSTASLWTPFALDALYGQPISISCALYPLLFTNAFIEIGEANILVFPKFEPNLTSTALERFERLYASRVRGIIYSHPHFHYLNSEARWIAALGCQLPPIWFPQLLSVQIDGSDDHLDRPCLSTILIVTRLLSPTVRFLFVSCGSSLAWMPNLQSSLPLLTSIKFHVSASESHKAWSRVLPTLLSVDSVAVSDIRFDGNTNLGYDVFNCLKKLPLINSLSVRTSNGTANHLPTIFSMFGSLHTLTELWLHELWGAPEKAFGLHDFEPLLQLRYLKEVFFRFSTKADLTDADIEVVLLAWPRLDSFRFIGLQFATINVLLPLARHPSLRVVEMYMDLAVELTPIVVPPILSQNSCSPGLTSLTLVQPNFDGLSYEPLALFISSVVPGVRCLCSSNYSFFQHETMETNTREFNEVLATISDNGHWSPETPRSQKLDN